MTDVAVLIPVHNGQKFITDAINSALTQTHPPQEVVVVDDGSTDGTLEILESFGDQIVVITQANQGVGAARNVAIAASRAPLIALLDADDTWYPTKLAQQVPIFEEHPSVGLSWCDFHYADDRLHFDRIPPDNRFVRNEVIADGLRLLLRANYPGACSNTVFRRAVVERVGSFAHDLVQAEDYEFWLRAAAVFDIWFDGAALMRKRAHDTNLSNDWAQNVALVTDMLEGLPNQVRALTGVEIADDDAYRDALMRSRIGTAEGLSRAGRHRTSMRQLASAVRADPRARGLPLVMAAGARGVGRALRRS